MSNRLFAPARAPVRRVGGGFDAREDRKQSVTSPTKPVETPSITAANPEARTSTPTVPGKLPLPATIQSEVHIEAPKVEPQKLSPAATITQSAVHIEAPEVDYEIAHFAPALQRFWQKAKLGLLSPRSLRFAELLPKPMSGKEATLAKLSHVRDEVAAVIENTRKIQQLVGANLKRHFEMIPQEKLTEAIHDIFKAYDANENGFLETCELKVAFSSMGKVLSDAELVLIIKEYDVDGNGQFDVDEFEDMIRSTLNLHKTLEA